MGSGKSEKTRETTSTKITAAHLAGLRPRPAPDSPIGKWDASTTFLAGFALALFALPELGALLSFASGTGVPHPPLGLLLLLGVVALFGVFPAVFVQHFYIQNICTHPNRTHRIVSTLAALALMFFATAAMKPLVGYDQKLAEDHVYAERMKTRDLKPGITPEPNRAPASNF